MAVQFCCFCCDLRKGVYIGSFILAIITVLCVPLYFLYLKDGNEDFTGYDAFFVGIVSVYFIIRTTLVYGAYKNSRGFILPYLIVEFILLLLSSFFDLLLLFQGATSVRDIFYLAFFWYFWYCVLSLYQKLDPNPKHIPQQLPNSDKTSYMDQQNDATHQYKFTGAV